MTLAHVALLGTQSTDISFSEHLKLFLPADMSKSSTELNQPNPNFPVLRDTTINMRLDIVNEALAACDLLFATGEAIMRVVHLGTEEEKPSNVVESIVSLGISQTPLVFCERHITRNPAQDLRWHQQIHVLRSDN